MPLIVDSVRRVAARPGARRFSRSPSPLVSSLSTSPTAPPPRLGTASRSLPSTAAPRTTTSGITLPPVGRCRTPGCTSSCPGPGRPSGTRSRSHRPAPTSRCRSQPPEFARAGLPSRGTHRTDTLRLTVGKSNGKVSMLNRRVESGSRRQRLTSAPLAAYPQRCADRTCQSIPGTHGPRLRPSTCGVTTWKSSSTRTASERGSFRYTSRSLPSCLACSHNSLISAGFQAACSAGTSARSKCRA